jgi:hypothetical protein
LSDDIGRNSLCPCGSKKKYKFCCEGDGLNNNIKNWVASLPFQDQRHAFDLFGTWLLYKESKSGEIDPLKLWIEWNNTTIDKIENLNLKKNIVYIQNNVIVLKKSYPLTLFKITK